MREELKKCMCDADFGQKANKRLLDKETSIKLFNETMDQAIKINGDMGYKRSENFDSIVDELFSMENVHVALTPCEYHFDKNKKYVGEFPTHTRRSLHERDVIDSVKEYLEKGAVVYLYMFYCVEQEIVFQEKREKADTYWWRMVTKLDE